MTAVAEVESPAQDVFINYRTGDGDKAAIYIHRELAHRFGAERIFRASDSIVPGQIYTDELLEKARRSAVMIVVIGPNWTRSSELGNSDDWVRREILEAHSNKVTIVPVHDGRLTERLRTRELPEDLKWLATVQSYRLDEHNISRDLTTLGDILANIVPALRQADGARPAPGTASPIIHNHLGEAYGPSLLGNAISGDGGVIAKGNSGPTHTGTGDQYNNSQHVTGEGRAGHFVAGDVYGGFGNQYGTPKGPESEK
ncbi:toll/interleukin-1 receptor domain-containing protein [Frankia sp. Mgl5]|uniref:toll/interleukin-1 receptor domain-containing protein n=1 Tax=Frankia sp. Mgl5 TaxID=2933793 RepID=UPI00200BEA26|nr:toll/interleukin-1 receptor domain-containing protein [Frankia sp. Mgl5]MCK9928670.1 toll/interleukin-1 receptor domain-containing protein [Frankia sp. Mgl5]